MKININDIIPGKYRLSRAIWKFDSLVLDENIILGEKEIKKLKKWNINFVNVTSYDENKGSLIDIISSFGDDIDEEFIYKKGITDVVKKESIELLKEINISKISSIEELENIDFDIDIENCVIPDDIYLEEISKKIDIKEKEILQSNKELIKFLEKTFTIIKNYEKIDIRRLKSFITLKIDENEKFPEKLFKSIYMNSSENYIYSHSVNVMILSIMVAYRLGYSKNRMAELAVAAIFHDVGMSRIDEKYYLNNKKFSFDDYFEIFKHPILGADYLTMGLKSRFGGLVTLAIYQHHERLDGSGYPRGREGKSICEYGRIIGICDLFEAMTNSREYRKNYSSKETFKYIYENSDILFDKKIVDIFSDILSDNRVIKKDDFNYKNVEKKPTILIADKSPFNMWYICHILSENNINTVSINNTHKILEKIKSIKPDIILVDGSISKENGIDVLKIIKENMENRINLIYSSNSGDKKDVLEALNIGIKDYLKKPYTFDFIINRLLKFFD